MLNICKAVFYAYWVRKRDKVDNKSLKMYTYGYKRKILG